MRFSSPVKARKHVNITALIDVVFILLLFFMLATRFDRYQVIDIQSSPSPGQKTISEIRKTHQLRIGPANRFWLDGIEMNRKQLEATLQQLRQAPATPEIIVTSDGDSLLQQTVNIMELLRENHFERISLLTSNHEN